MSEPTLREVAQALYVASRASLPERPSMWRELRDTKGWPIISTWIDEAGPGETDDMGDLWVRIASEVASAHGLILYAEPGDFPLKGAHTEVGMALALGKRVGVCIPGVDLDDSWRPLGSWAAHPLVCICPTLAYARKWVDEQPAASPAAPVAVEPVATLTDERIQALADKHVNVVGAGYVRPAEMREFARAVEAISRALPCPEKPIGWVTMWPSPRPKRSHEPVYTPGPEKPSYGHELDARLTVSPVYGIPARTGWRWVPEKITVEMADAWAEAGRQAMSTNSQRYRAMIDAAPTPLPTVDAAESATQLQQAVERALLDLKFHPSASHVEPNYRDWFNKTMDAAINTRKRHD